MTAAQEIAKELIDKYSFVLLDYDFDETITAAKRCALIEIDGILKLLDEQESNETGKVLGHYGQNIWKEAKDEINA